jgi:hypothetical protein
VRTTTVFCLALQPARSTATDQLSQASFFFCSRIESESKSKIERKVKIEKKKRFVVLTRAMRFCYDAAPCDRIANIAARDARCGLTGASVGIPRPTNPQCSPMMLLVSLCRSFCLAESSTLLILPSLMNSTRENANYL